MDKNAHIAVLGARGLVGSAIVRSLMYHGYKNILKPSHKEMDLRDKTTTREWFNYYHPDYVFFAAAKVGGIQANINMPASFGIENMEMINNVFQASEEFKVQKLLFLGSSCIYPAQCKQPMKEEYLFDGKFEPTNEMYAISKAYGIKLCSAFRKQYGSNFISCQPCNIYGPGDNFDPTSSHVIAALIRKFYEAKRNNIPEVICWGDGLSRREIMYSEDLGMACVFLMNNYNDSEFINVGTGVDMTIRELSETIAKISGYTGSIIQDTTKPNGMRQKLLDVSKITTLGWKPTISTEEGLRLAYKWFANNIGDKQI